MNQSFALKYIERRMQELGFENNYILRFQTYRIDPKQVMKISERGQFFYLIDPDPLCVVRSFFGAFDKSEKNIAQLQYEFRGELALSSSGNETIFVDLIQVVPNHLKPDSND